MLTYIDISRITPHPDNPRKDLGDLTELAESIKAKGILQNLTVVPKDGMNSTTDFTVVIGHRRLAAAKLAGLKEVPCTIADMTPQEQIATMLLENMQRSDLTVYEQAQGFQMMLNFDYSVTDIAEKTGFSETTVRHRVKLLELDNKKFKESISRGATLMDYAELEKIKDIKLRNKVLEKIGTSDFKWTLQSTIDEEERPKRKEALIKELQKFAKPCKNDKGLTFINAFYNFKTDNWKKPADADKTEYYYLINNTSIHLYKKEAKKEKKKENPSEKIFHEKEARLKDLTKRAYESRYEFIKNFSAAKKYRKEIMDFAMRKLLIYGRAESEEVFKILEIDKPAADEKSSYNEQWNLERELILEKYLKNPEYVMLCSTYLGFGDSKNNKYYYAHSWELKIAYEKNRDLDTIYDSLISLGYELADEEKQLRDGTHELFAKVEEAE